MLKLPKPLYKTHSGQAYADDSGYLLTCLPDESVDLVITSPPFALQRQKEYGNHDQADYIDWLLSFTPEIKRIKKPAVSYLTLEAPIRKGGQFARCTIIEC